MLTLYLPVGGSEHTPETLRFAGPTKAIAPEATPTLSEASFEMSTVSPPGNQTRIVHRQRRDNDGGDPSALDPLTVNVTGVPSNGVVPLPGALVKQ